MKFRLRLCAIFTIASYCCVAQATAPSRWQIGQEFINVALFDSKRAIWLSSWCSEKKPCEAFHAMKHIEKNPLIAETFKDEPAGLNPGSINCRRVFKTQVFLARGKPGETQGFCRFADGSLISLNAL